VIGSDFWALPRSRAHCKQLQHMRPTSWQDKATAKRHHTTTLRAICLYLASRHRQQSSKNTFCIDIQPWTSCT